MPRKTRPGNWARLHTRIMESPNILALLEERGGLEACAVYMFSVGWCKDRGTDGALPPGCLRLLHGTRKHADLLVKHNLWESRTGGGWRIPFAAYAAWQDTAEEVEAARAAKARAGQLSNCRRHHPQPCHLPACRAVHTANNVIPLTLEDTAHA